MLRRGDGIAAAGEPRLRLEGIAGAETQAPRRGQYQFHAAGMVAGHRGQQVISGSERGLRGRSHTQSVAARRLQSGARRGAAVHLAQESSPDFAQPRIVDGLREWLGGANKQEMKNEKGRRMERPG